MFTSLDWGFFMHNKLIIDKGEYILTKNYSGKIFSAKLTVFYQQKRCRVRWIDEPIEKTIKNNMHEYLYDFAQKLIIDKSNRNFYQ